MSSISSAGSKFYHYMESIDGNFALVASKLPLQGMQSFDVKENGRFKLIYAAENRGNADHSEEKWQKRMANISIKVAKVVTGTIDAQNKSIRFDKGCVVATKGGFISINVSVTEVKVCSSRTFKVAGKLGYLPERAVDITSVDVMGSIIGWNN